MILTADTVQHLIKDNCPDMCELSNDVVMPVTNVLLTRSSAIAEGLREALVSRNPATTKHLT